MNSFFSIVPATRTFTDQGPSTYSDYMLCELLAMQDELITRLRVERDLAGGSAESFLTGVINRHEQDLVKLRGLLEDHLPDAT